MSQPLLPKARRSLAAHLLALLLVTSCAAQPPAASNAPQVEPPAADAASQSAPPSATTQPATDPQTRSWLERIGHKHADVRTLHAQLVYDRIQGVLGDTQRRLGTLTYEAGPPARFAVHFDRLLVDQRLVEQDRWYVFDGHWLVERLVTERQFLAYEVVPPTSAPVDPLAIGQGPFVVPISPDPQRLLARFSVAMIDETAEEEPPGSIHLRLTPRADRAGEFTRIDIWYDRDTLLPMEVWTLDDSENESRVMLREPQVNGPVDAIFFDTQPPGEHGCDVQISPWEGKP